MDRDSLYELRSLLALYPYFQTARILLLQNLYLLHDPTFDEELRRAAIYITDRRVLFRMIEAAHYQLPTPDNALEPDSEKLGTIAGSGRQKPNEDRTISLIDSFLQSIPVEEDQNETKSQRKPTPADASVDYVAYLMETAGGEIGFETATPPLRGQGLIDNFLENEGGKIKLAPDTQVVGVDGDATEKPEEVHTEALARIYVRQRHYHQARDIIRQLHNENPQQNVYFTDQLRFLDKLIINEQAASAST